MVPQSDVVGVRINVMFFGRTLQSFEIFFTISSGGFVPTSKTMQVEELLSL